ncbi:thioredoxin-related transmembrane protein 2 homolog isoform X5 [Phoenix dactylifera]|nr:thioredoxin-related transmembrane protein 2 homolog isoform X5 [Phoenix dactylifera]
MEPAKTATANGKNRNHPFPWLNLLVTEPFYLLHFLAFFSYFVVRSSVPQTISSDLSHLLLRREMQAILTFLVLVSVKMVKEETWEAFIADTLFYAKGFLFAVALVINYHLAFCYLLGFIVIYVVCQQPPYDGLGDSSQLTPLQLESLLTEGKTSRFWLVEFRTLCSSTWIRTSRVFPELSTIYSNKNISFGIVDIGHFPNAAETFGVSLWGPFDLDIDTQVSFQLIYYLTMRWKFLDFQISIVPCQLLPRNFFANILSSIGGSLSMYQASTSISLLILRPFVDIVFVDLVALFLVCYKRVVQMVPPPHSPGKSWRIWTSCTVMSSTSLFLYSIILHFPFSVILLSFNIFNKCML